VETLKNTALIPKERGFMHVAEQWHPEVTNAEYVPPEKYAEIMQDSVFTPCPKGRSLDTFRLYESIESGSIPVIELAGGYARQHLPAEYFDSPILFVETWEAAPAMMMELVKDTGALIDRQKKLKEWYNGFMKKVVGRLEALLEARRAMS